MSARTLLSVVPWRVSSKSASATPLAATKSANVTFVAPSFDDAKDEEARAILQRVFPEHRVVMVPGREILLGGGNIHCITQQQPAPQRR